MKIRVNLATMEIERTRRTRQEKRRNVVSTHDLFFSKLLFTELMFLGPARPSQNASVSANYSDTHMTLPPVPNSLNISRFFSSQSSNEVSHTRPRIESTENGKYDYRKQWKMLSITFLFSIHLERSNSFDDRNGVTDEIMSSPVIPRQQLAVARKSTPSPSAPLARKSTPSSSAPTSPDVDASKFFM